MKKWYLHAWFIALIFCLSFLIVPFFIGIVLVVLSETEDAKVYGAYQAQSTAEHILHSANYQAEQIKLEAQNQAQEQNQAILNEIKLLQEERDRIMNEINELSKESLIKSVSIEPLLIFSSNELKNKIQMLKLQQTEMQKENAILVQPSTLTKREQGKQIKQILRCFNAECANILERTTVKNVDAMRSKILSTYKALNSLYQNDFVSINPDYLNLKFDELTLAHAEMVKREQEKEEQRAIREQMLDEEKARQEIEREKKRIEKEEAQFNSEINRLMKYLHNTNQDVEKQLYIDKIKDLEEKLKALMKDKEDVLHREENTRAGFVYIISNIGSFGEDVYKIGMTRRLEPMDRIKELSSASVPFPFDVHAMIFSEDAPALETLLHQTFKDNQVNKINARKEFYRIELDAIKKLVLANHNATVKFIDIPDAVEYRESLKVS